MQGEMIGVLDLSMARKTRTASMNTDTHVKLEMFLANRSAPLSRREEMVAIGLVMVLHNEDSDMAYYVTQKLKLDPEKYKAVLGLIGCTDEELKKDDEKNPKRQYKAALQEVMDGTDGELQDL